MKICIMGCGNQGTGIAGLLAQEDDVEELILADNDINRATTAEALIKSMGNIVKTRSIKTAQADAHNSQEIAKVAEGVDLIFNGIFPSCNIPIMQACLKIGAHYTDLFSWAVEGPDVPRSETIDAQLELDEKFKSAGITAIPSLGIAPGWSNLVTRYIIDKLDTVDSVITRTVDWIDSKELLAPVVPWQVFYLWLGPPHPTYIENGQFKKIDLLESEEEYELPRPIGKQKVYTFAQDPDIVLLDRFSGKSIRHVEAKMAICMGGLSMKDVWIKAISEQTSKHVGADNMFELFGQSLKITTDFKTLCDEGKLKAGALGCSVEVTGAKSGVAVRHTAYCVTTLSESMKHIPWAGHNVYGTVGGMVIELILALCRGELNQQGVLKTASLDNPELWFKKMKARGQLLSEKIERDTIF
jgi:saccharopine dehydrogenase-like NADP-dependent oxidoreductase